MTLDRITSLVAVREVLNKTDSQHTPLFISLIDNGKYRPFDCKSGGRLVFGPGKDDFPSLGKNQSPFDSNALPSLKDLQKLLIADLHTSRKRYFHHCNDAIQPAADESQTVDDDQLKQLDNLADTSHDTSGVVLSFPSPSLDDICGDNKVEYDNVVRESMTVASILPRDTLLSLQHSNEGTTFTTLLSGSVAWIIWPPTKENLEILQSCYDTFVEGFDGTKMDASSELEGGVCLVQTAGDAIRIPPFCPMMCLSLGTSILATYSVVTATQLADMLHKLPLLLAWFKTELDGERKKNDFVAALLPHISAILQGNFEADNLRKFEYPYVQEGPLRSLLQTWDEIKHEVASILGPVETQRIMAMWTDFLGKAKGRRCWICGNHISNKQKDMPKHFETKHWPTEEATEAVEHVEKTPKQPRNTSVPQSVAEEGDEDSFHDAMEVIELRPGARRGPAEEAVTSSSARERTAEPHEGEEMEVDKRPETPVHFC